jgi:bifunctional DNA-binding transcriptional regulator/antitoxin component of YhaV-PrlF toxin-antitoxin module
MKAIKLTSKRQATFPRDLCEAMGLEPGDAVLVEEKVVDGERLWVLRRAKDIDWSWFGSLRQYAKGKPHDMGSIRASIGKALGRGRP